MADILTRGVVIELESVFKSDGIDAVIKKLEELQKANGKVNDALDFSKAGDELKKEFRKTFNELDAVYEDYNKKLAEKDVRFAKFRNQQIKSGLDFTEKEIKHSYDNVVALNKKLNADLERADKERINSTKTLLGKATGELQEGLRRHISTLTGIQESTLQKIGSNTALNATGVAAAIAYSIVKLAEFGEQAEQTKLKFNSFINASGKTNKLDEELNNIAKKTGISGDALNEAALSLLKFGVEAEKIPNKLGQINSIAAKLGIPVATLAEQLGRIEFKNFANKFDLNTLEREGIPIFQQLAIVTGKSTDELRKLAKISSEDVSKALDNLTKSGGEFGDVLDKQTNSLTGYKNKLSETFNVLKEDIGEAFIPAAKAIVGALKDILDVFSPYIVSWSKTIGGAIGGLFFEIKTLGSGIRLAFDPEFQAINKSIEKAFGKKVADSILSTGENSAFGIQLQQQLAIQRDINAEIDKELDRIALARRKKTADNAFLDKQEALKRSQRVDLTQFALNAVTKELIGVDKEKVFTPEDQEAADQKIIAERKRLYDQLLKLQLEFRENQIKIGREGLFSVDSLKSENDVSKFQDTVLKKILSIQDVINNANNIGVQFPIAFKLDLEEQLRILNAQLDRSSEVAFIQKLPIKIGKIEFQDKDGNRLNISKQIKDITDGQNFDDQFGDPDQLNVKEKGSKFLTLLFGDDKEQQDRGEKALISAQENIKKGLNLFFEAEQRKTDFLIEQQRKRIEDVNKVAALGNAEQLQIEEDRLRKLEEKRAQSVRRQNAINALQIVSQTALSVSSFATAITKQAVQEHPVTAIAEGVALLAAVFAGIAQIKSLTQGFYEGTEYVDQKGHHKSGIDTVPSMLTRGERVLTVEQNEALGSISNKEVVRLTRLGRMMDINSGSSIYLDPNKNYSDQYQRETVNLLKQQNEKLDRNTEAINNTFVEIRFDESSWRITQSKANKNAQKRAKVF